MNAHTPGAQRLSAILSQVATVAAIRTTSLGLTRRDASASTELDQTHAAQDGTFAANAKRLTKEGVTRVKEINSTANAARAVLAARTTAWGERRLLANVNIQPLMQEYMAQKNEYDRLVTSFVGDAPRLIAESAVNLRNVPGVEPPTVEEISTAFSLEFTLEQIPDSGSFQAAGMDKAVEDELKRRFEANIEAAYQQAQNDALLRLQKPLAALVERMTAYNKREEELAKGIDVGREGYFRDTIIQNVADIAAVFDSFNLTGDPSLKAISDKLAAFEGIEAEDLRKSKSLRDDTAKRAQEILATLGDWL